MFIWLSSIVVATILVVLSLRFRTKNNSTNYHYQLWLRLRQILLLLRAHRHLSTGQTKSSQQLLETQQNLSEHCHQLVNLAAANDKAGYRVLMANITKLRVSSRKLSQTKNQLWHGQLIRQCIYLVDDLVMNWLLEHQDKSQEQRYQTHWMWVIDAMEGLTQFRISLSQIGELDGRPFAQSKLRVQALQLTRQIHQLTLLNSNLHHSPIATELLQHLEQFDKQDDQLQNQDKLFELSNRISEFISVAYDDVVADIFHQNTTMLTPSTQGKVQVK